MTRETVETLGAALQGIGWLALPFMLLPLIILCVPHIRFSRDLGGHFISILDGLNYAIGEVVKWALPVMVIAVVMSVVLLSIFGISITKMDELPTYLHAATIMLGSAATLLAGQHVRVDIFHSQMSPNRKAFIDIIGFYALIIPTCIILLWMSQGFVSQSWVALEGSNEADGIRGIFLIKTLLPLFAISVVAQGLSIALRAALALRGYERPQRPEHIPPLFGHMPEAPK